jgi:hypothetical protein
MFLTDDELYQLTGYRQARKQCAMLRQQGVAFFINAAGHPRVARTTIEGRQQPAPQPTKKSWAPSWAGIRP